MIQYLPPELVEKIFSYLDFRSLVRCELVCQYWRYVARSDVLWRRLYALSWLIDSTPDIHDISNYREEFATKCRTLGRYVDSYKAINQAWLQIEKFLGEKHVRVQLAAGLTEAEIDELERQMLDGRRIPNDLRCYWLKHDGDSVEMMKTRPQWTVTAGDDDVPFLRQTESLVSLRQSPTEDLMYICSAGFCPFTVSHTIFQGDLLLGRSAKCVALPNNELGLPCGSVVSLPLYVTSLDGLKEVRVLARSYMEWFVRFANELAEDYYPVYGNQISGFRREPHCVTHRQISSDSVITVRGGVVYVPDFSVMAPSKIIMSYCVEVQMNADANKRDECCLEARSMHTFDQNGELRKVETEAGVNLRNPCVGPGTFFHFSSFTGVVGDSGRLTGDLTFRRLRDNLLLKMETPTIRFELPPRVPVMRRDTTQSAQLSDLAQSTS